MVFGSREMVSGHRSMVLPGSDMPSALGLVFDHFPLIIFDFARKTLNPIPEENIQRRRVLSVMRHLCVVPIHYSLMVLLLKK